MTRKRPLIVSLVVSLGVGGLSALLTRRGMRLYDLADKPPLTPPDWVFGVVWTILFILMGIAAYRIWVSDAPTRRQALCLYGAQLIFNFFWSMIFFNARAYGAALAWLVLLWVLILLTTIAFRRIDRAAGRLMLPYLVWVTFAVYLNAGVWLLDR